MTNNDESANGAPGSSGGAPNGGAPGSAPSPPPQGGQAPPPPGGQAPPPSGGAGGGSPLRKLNKKRVGAVVLVVLVVIGGVAAVALGGLPALPSLGPCTADAPNVSVATHQSAGPDGQRVALQLTTIGGTEYVAFDRGDTEVANMTGVGNTTTVTGLSNGETIEYVGATKCGEVSVGNYTVQ